MSVFDDQRAIVADPNLSAKEKQVLLTLLVHCDKERTCWPSINRLAAECSVSRSSIKRHLTTLRDKGFVESRPAFRDNKGQTSNHYRIIIRQSFVDPHTTTEPEAWAEDEPPPGSRLDRAIEQTSLTDHNEQINTRNFVAEPPKPDDDVNTPKPLPQRYKQLLASIKKTNPAVNIPESHSKDCDKWRDTMRQAAEIDLITLYPDKPTAREVLMRILEWVFSDDADPEAQFWHKQIGSLGHIRVKSRNNGLPKIINVHTQWKKSTGGLKDAAGASTQTTKLSDRVPGVIPIADRSIESANWPVYENKYVLDPAYWGSSWVHNKQGTIVVKGTFEGKHLYYEVGDWFDKWRLKHFEFGTPEFMDHVMDLQNDRPGTLAKMRQDPDICPWGEYIHEQCESVTA